MGAIRKSVGAIRRVHREAEISRRFGAPQMADTATNGFRNLRSPESAGEIRMIVGAIRRVHWEAEISRRFGAPQMADTATNGFRDLRSPESAGEIRMIGRAKSARALGAQISRSFGAPQMAGRARRRDRSAARTATNAFRNLRSPESVGEIRMISRAHSARALGAEISRRFGAPQMAGRARRRDRSAARTTTNGFRNLRSPESVGEIRMIGRAKSARALGAQISRSFGAPQMAGRARRSD